MVRALHRLMLPLQRRVMLMVGRCVIRLVQDSLKLQGLQITLLEGETRTAQRLQEFGFTSVPLDGCEGIAVAVTGNRDHLVVIATDDDRKRPTGLEQGEVCIYDAEDQRIHLKKGKILHIHGVQEFRIEAETIKLGREGQTLRALVDERILAALAAHQHGGVAKGADVSGPPVAPILAAAVCTEVTKAG